MTLLKRYANRRLYDTRLSRYITLEEMAHRIRKGEDFQVLDAQTDEDLTRKVLMQIILLESLDIADLLPSEFLVLLIRVRERGVQELFVRYLKVTMEAFSIANRQLEDNVRLVQQQVSVTAHLMRKLIPLGRGHQGEHFADAHAGAPAGAAGAVRASVFAEEAPLAPGAVEPGPEVIHFPTAGAAEEAILPDAEAVLFASSGSGGRRAGAGRRRRG